MSLSGSLVYEVDTDFSHYQIWDLIYDGRAARVLYSGKRQTAQSGVPRDGRPDVLFDYNQRFYELVSALLPKRLLLIGGGVYSLPMALLATLPSLQIDVVELDAGLDELARRFFGLRDDKRLRIIHADGRDYVARTKLSYDLILMDAFAQDIIPPALVSIAAITDFKRILTANGLVATNLIAALRGAGAETITQLLATYRTTFQRATVYPASHDLSPWQSQNLILVAEAGKRSLADSCLRYPALKIEHLSPTNQSSDEL